MVEGSEEWLSALRTVGNIVTFGQYEQDNDFENGQEPIEWIVLDVQGGKSLLLSKYALDCRPYQSGTTHNVTWEKSELRSWLNSEFFDTAFERSEQGEVVSTVLENYAYYRHGPKLDSSTAQAKTTDRVFILDDDAIWECFPSAKDRECIPTDYAIAQGAFVDPEVDTCWWWMRQIYTGRYGYGMAYLVDSKGSRTFGNMDLTNNAVRPAIWVDNTGLSTKGYEVSFGHYEQDNDSENGPEPIEWVVLDTNNGQSLLISKYALDWRPFHEPSSNVPWESSLLRRWLNGEFLKSAFTDTERKAITTTTVENTSKIRSQEQVYLLSLAEAQEYYPEETQRVCEPTIYALGQGTFTADNGYCAWWLRSAGSGTAQYILNNGTRGDYIPQKELAVRPVLWVNQEAIKQVYEQEKIQEGLQNANTLGEMVTFGRYKQNTADERSTDPIEWLVLDTQGNKSLLISKYVLDGKAFDESGNHTTWDNSSLRTWLNQTFLEEAFSPLEKKHIVNTYVDNSYSQGFSGYHTYAGSSTYDYVFLLSYAEADKYFQSDEERVAGATEFAGSTLAIQNRDHCKWWLRSPGYIDSYSKKNGLFVVHSDGMLGYDVISTSIKGVRPAIWIMTG